MPSRPSKDEKLFWTNAKDPKIKQRAAELRTKRLIRELNREQKKLNEQRSKLDNDLLTKVKDIVNTAWEKKDDSNKISDQKQQKNKADGYPTDYETPSTEYDSPSTDSTVEIPRKSVPFGEHPADESFLNPAQDWSGDDSDYFEELSNQEYKRSKKEVKNNKKKKKKRKLDEVRDPQKVDFDW